MPGDRPADPGAGLSWRLRRAIPAEAAGLRALAHRSKAYWPYDEAFLQRVRPMLQLTPQDVATSEVWVLEIGGAVAGWHRVTFAADHAELEDLWLEPARIGTGWGRVLFEHAVRLARAAGAGRLEWDAEPYAQDFYERMGGTEIGRVPSAAAEGRTLPRMRLDL